MGIVRELTRKTFDDAIKNGRVLVDFWAAWCAPCQMQAPVIEKLAWELKHIKFTKVNVEEEGSLAERFGIRGIPTLVIFNNGSIERILVGYHGEAQLRTALS